MHNYLRYTTLYMYLMPLKTLGALHILETEFTEIDNWFCSQLLRVRGEVPWFHTEPPQLNHVDVFHSGDDIIRSMASSTARGHMETTSHLRGWRICEGGGRTALSRLGLCEDGKGFMVDKIVMYM